MRVSGGIGVLGLQYFLPNFCFVQTNLQIQELAYSFDCINCHGDKNSLLDCQLGSGFGCNSL